MDEIAVHVVNRVICSCPVKPFGTQALCRDHSSFLLLLISPLFSPLASLPFFLFILPSSTSRLNPVVFILPSSSCRLHPLVFILPLRPPNPRQENPATLSASLGLPPAKWRLRLGTANCPVSRMHKLEHPTWQIKSTHGVSTILILIR